MSENNLTFIEHFEILRGKIISSLIFIVLATFVSFFLADGVINYLKNVPHALELSWNVFSPWDTIRIYVLFTIGIAIFLAIPFMFFQIWSFVSSSLHSNEKLATFIYVPTSVILLYLGFIFSYYIILPLVFNFSQILGERIGTTEAIGIIQYFSFVFYLVIPITVLFQFPVLIMFLTRLGIINHTILKKARKVSYFIMVIISVIISPPDILTDLLITIPLIGLYELSIILSALVQKSLKK
ncbi:twin-arginine translocase subunit TatC [Evansella clarkii]|uniref:twin-arginine translocase subunit TatC n=1 Tax=Evansella clarkii TaxID=79879 RepID=UPI0009978CB3|nr:twin-arginine translocase subunit TatC [Evansella clarkii]